MADDFEGNYDVVHQSQEVGIDPLLSQQIADILANVGEEHGFDAATCSEVAILPFEEAFETAYSYLLQAELDPDVILGGFIEE